jgi:hypothetical protein
MLHKRGFAYRKAMHATRCYSKLVRLPYKSLDLICGVCLAMPRRLLGNLGSDVSDRRKASGLDATILRKYSTGRIS